MINYKVESVLEDDLVEAIDKYNILVNKEQIDYMQTEVSP